MGGGIFDRYDEEFSTGIDSSTSSAPSRLSLSLIPAAKPAGAGGQATVSVYLKTVEVAGLRWPDIAEWSEDQVMHAVAPSREKPSPETSQPGRLQAVACFRLDSMKHQR